jgi:hypothetical protein
VVGVTLATGWADTGNGVTVMLGTAAARLPVTFGVRAGLGGADVVRLMQANLWTKEATLRSAACSCRQRCRNWDGNSPANKSEAVVRSVRRIVKQSSGRTALVRCRSAAKQPWRSPMINVGPETDARISGARPILDTDTIKPWRYKYAECLVDYNNLGGLGR